MKLALLFYNVTERLFLSLGFVVRLVLVGIIAKLLGFVYTKHLPTSTTTAVPLTHGLLQLQQTIKFRNTTEDEMTKYTQNESNTVTLTRRFRKCPKRKINSNLNDQELIVHLTTNHNNRCFHCVIQIHFKLIVRTQSSAWIINKQRKSYCCIYLPCLHQE